MAGKLVCWRCGVPLKDVAKPIPRLAKCQGCGADLHVCRLCRFYNPRVIGRCDHELAEPAREVDVANFCQYFKPKLNAYSPDEASEAEAAKAELKALFGEDSGTDEAPSGASSTRSTGKPAGQPEDPLEQLRALFGEGRGDGRDSDDQDS